MKIRLTLAFTILFVIQTLILVAWMGKLPNLNPTPERTSIPTLIPARLSAPTLPAREISFGGGACQVRALELLGAWVMAGKPASGVFEFLDVTGRPCLASFDKEILPLFTQPNIWYGGSIACSACHGTDVNLAAARLSLASYSDLLAGSQRQSADQTGKDILGDPSTWQQSRLFIMIATRQMPMGTPPEADSRGPLIWVGVRK